MKDLIDGFEGDTITARITAFCKATDTPYSTADKWYFGVSKPNKWREREVRAALRV